MNIKHLCFVGPSKPPAIIEFNDGLNLIYGPSNTGKSSILDGIDFMLGRERPLKEIPQHVGYSEVLLGIAFSDGSEFTLVRSISGGNYRLFESLHQIVPEETDFIVLREKKSTIKEKSLSDFILGKIGLLGKNLKKNAKNGKERLTIRTLLPLFFVNETEIQREGTPFKTGQYTKATSEISRLKMLLTGVDDSALISEEVLEKEKISRSARAGVLGELIQDMHTKILDIASEETSIEDLRKQNNRLSVTIDDANTALQLHEKSYYEALSNKNLEQRHFRESTERLSEVTTMSERFKLLLKHYGSDIDRLDGIIESGALVSALSTETCPLCGASSDNQNIQHSCDGNIDNVVEAASAEKQKINALKIDLLETLDQLEEESEIINVQLVSQRTKLDASVTALRSMAPDLTKTRSSYAELIRTRSKVSKSIDLFETIEGLQERLESSRKPKEEEATKSENKVPEIILFGLAEKIKEFLDAWGLPNSETVHFSSDTTDIVLNGKHRISNGKGHRSITHAAVTLGLSKFLIDKSLPSLGFVVLDSPLIAYEEPDNDSEDISEEDSEIAETDLNEKFFDSLTSWQGTQTIIFENKKSITDRIKKRPNITHFTKKHGDGRYGFFPSA